MLNDVDEIIHRYTVLSHSARIIAKDYGVHHEKITDLLRACGVELRNKSESAKLTWKTHVHPNKGKTGEQSCMFGRKLSIETKAKIGASHTGAKHYNWSGGRKNHSGGYVMVYRPEHKNADACGYIHEHRLIMESFIGRELTREEIVHHIDGDKKNNCIDNLALMNRAAHAKIHQLERANSYAKHNNDAC